MGFAQNTRVIVKETSSRKALQMIDFILAVTAFVAAGVIVNIIAERFAK